MTLASTAWVHAAQVVSRGLDEPVARRSIIQQRGDKRHSIVLCEIHGLGWLGDLWLWLHMFQRITAPTDGDTRSTHSGPRRRTQRAPTPIACIG